MRQRSLDPGDATACMHLQLQLNCSVSRRAQQRQQSHAPMLLGSPQ